jgi:phage tail-like protein
MKRSEIERLLPVVFQRTVRPGNPLWALLDLMEALHQPFERAIENIDTVFNPYTAPDRFVRFLADWVDLGRYLTATTAGFLDRGGSSRPISIDLGRLRELIAGAVRLSQWRGTAKGLRLFLETATGIGGFELEEKLAGPDGSSQVFHFRVRAPKAAAPYRELIHGIINGEKPAYVTYELEFAPANGGNI